MVVPTGVDALEALDSARGALTLSSLFLVVVLAAVVVVEVVVVVVGDDDCVAFELERDFEVELEVVAVVVVVVGEEGDDDLVQFSTESVIVSDSAASMSEAVGVLGVLLEVRTAVLLLLLLLLLLTASFS